MGVVGIRREDKSEWERRAPLVPEDVADLVASGVDIVVQRSPRRCFADGAYERAGARLVDDLSGADVILGVKEVPLGEILPGRTWMFFSHTIKGQPYNMPLLRTLLDQGGTLFDYELVTDEKGVRTIAFGRYAGLAGAIDTLWALGQRFESEGITTPFAAMRQSLDYPDLAAAEAAVDTLAAAIRSDGLPAGLAPLAIAVTGEGGKVWGGAVEILRRLPVREVEAEDLAAEAAGPGDPHEVLLVNYGPGDLVEPVDPSRSYSWEDYRDHPDRYRARFGRALPFLTAIVHGILWSPGYPRFILRNDLAALFSEPEPPRLRLVTEVTCDLGGSNEALVRTTDAGAPTYVFDPATGDARDGHAGPGLVVLAVDILPAELPVDASRLFSESLRGVVPALAQGIADPADPALPGGLRRALIVHRGSLVPPWDEQLAAPLSEHGGKGGST